MSDNNSQSPGSVQGSSNSGSAITPPTAFATTGGKPGVVPIAAAPPKPPIQAPASTSRPLQVTPKRQRRQSRASTNILPTISAGQVPGDVEVPDVDETAVQARTTQAPITRTRGSTLNSTSGATTMASLVQGGNLLGHANSHPVGSQEWEWLTMSL